MFAFLRALLSSDLLLQKSFERGIDVILFQPITLIFLYKISWLFIDTDISRMSFEETEAKIVRMKIRKNKGFI